MNKKIISYAILPVLGLALLGSGITFAATNAGTSAQVDRLVSALSTKFNLQPTEVQKVIDQVRSEQHAAMEAKHAQELSARLTQAVSTGKLTQVQADKIIAKEAEIKAKLESLKDKTPAERQAAMKAYMLSLKQWATENNIPKQFMLFGPGKKFNHHGMKHDNMKDGETNDDLMPSAAPTIK